MANIAGRYSPAHAAEFRGAADHIHRQIVDNAWNPGLGAFVATYGGNDLDASLLEMAGLRFLPQDDERMQGTINAIWKNLSQDGWLLRYRTDDGFGRPTVTFILCSFWLVEALAAVGRIGEAREVMKHVLGTCSPLGLLSEDCETATRRMWGNFPQAYSHVGLIHAAFSASPRWADIL